MTPWKSEKEEADQAKLEELQFGHGYDTVEISGSNAHNDNRTQRFNSATAMTPWKYPTPGETRYMTSALQFGHGYDTVEIRTLAYS